MTRIYGKRTEVKGSAVNYFVSIQVDKLNQIEIRVTEEIFNALDELQSELWRLERKESRHCVHFESLKDCHIPHAYRAMSPEDVCVEKETTGDLGEALLHIPTKQRKRLLMHSVAGLTINEIARAEKCSERSIEYSLSLARKNLREILGEGYTPK